MRITEAEKIFIRWEEKAFGYGYGTGEMPIIEALRRFLRNLEDTESRPGIKRVYRYKTIEDELGPAVAWLLINALNSSDFLEYGTSPRNGWLTKTGEVIRDLFKEKTNEELYDILMSMSMEDRNEILYPEDNE